MLFGLTWETMETREIRHLLALAKHLNFTLAAEELGISQSALSKSIQGVEDRLQLRLFDRNRGGVRMTAVGRDLVSRATLVDVKIRDLAKFAAEAARGSSGKVAFGITPIPAKALLADLLSQMIIDRPQLSCRVVVRTADNLCEALANEEIEFFVSAEQVFAIDEAIDRSILGLFPAAIVVRPGHPLLVCPSESLPACLSKYPLILTGPFPLTSASSNSDLIKDHGVHYAIEGVGTIAKVVEQSDAFWLTSQFAVRDEIAQGRLSVLPYSTKLHPNRVMIYTLAHRAVSPAAREVIKVIRRQFAALTQDAGPIPA